ncbi:MAG TPA: PEGA domain-containing protein [Gallionella sp.]|nr:PEGA domain-containing protein [Gallionella sp.]
MKLFLQRVALFSLMMFVAGCSSVNRSVNGVKNSVGSMFNGSHTLDTAAIQRPVEEDANAIHIQYAATLRIDGYRDQRRGGNPRLLGMNTQPIYGLDKGQILVDQEVASLVATVMRNRFRTTGYQVMEGSAGAGAAFEVSGVIRELSLNIKDRDEANIVIETTVKESATGRVVWSGTVTERDDQYAGVFGDSKKDVTRYLNKELQLVAKKTVDAVSAVLPMVQPVAPAAAPIYNPRPIAGVTVTVAPEPVMVPAAAPVPAPAPAVAAPAPAQAAEHAPEYVPHATATSGLLVVNSTPSRASVYLDGVYFGMTPLRSEMKPSVHKLTVKLEGYKPVTEKISIRKGENTELDLKLSR